MDLILYFYVRYLNELPRGRAIEVSNRNSFFYFDAERRGIKPEKRLKQIYYVSAQKTVVNIKEEGFYISTKH